MPPLGCDCVDDRIYDFRGLRILGLGGSMRYKEGNYMYTEREMEKRIDRLRSAIALRNGFDIVVTHAPAQGYGDMDDLPHQGFRCFNELLERYLGPWSGKVDSVVLGCTHYPLVREQIREVMGDVPLFDGGEGTARETRRRLEAAGLLASSAQVGSVELRSSIDTPDELALYQRIFELAQR